MNCYFSFVASFILSLDLGIFIPCYFFSFFCGFFASYLEDLDQVLLYNSCYCASLQLAHRVIQSSQVIFLACIVWFYTIFDIYSPAPLHFP